MVTKTLQLTDEQSALLDWVAAERKTTVDELIQETLLELLRPLAIRRAEANKNELTALFSRLAPAERITYLEALRAAAGGSQP